MAEYDWLLTTDFQTQVDSQVARSAGNSGLARYQTRVVERIMEEIRKNKPIVESKEMVKAAAKRRTREDALVSVNDVIKLASELAKVDKRDTLTEADFNTAFERNYCNFWPICQGQ